MRLSPLNIVLLLASSQGLFLSLLIFHKHRRVFANRFLGLLIFLYSLMLLHLVAYELGFYSSHAAMTAMVVGCSFVMGPLHYLYASYLTHPGRGYRKRDGLHFIPFLLFEFLILLLGSGSPAFLSVRRGVMGVPVGFLVLNWIIILQGLCYMVMTLRVLKRYATTIRNVFSTLDLVRLDWLNWITIAAMAFIGIFIVENVFFLFGVNLSHYFNLTSFLMAAYVYGVGYAGLLKSEVLTDPVRRAPVTEAGEDFDTPSGKYDKSGLSPDKAESIHKALLSLMDKKQPYTDPDLTLGGLAGSLGVSPHNLSEVINTRIGSNFFDFISRYRVDRVRRDLTNPDKKNLKLLAIAFEAGFNSKSSFNSVFKKFTDTTPSRFRRNTDSGVKQ